MSDLPIKNIGNISSAEPSKTQSVTNEPNGSFEAVIDDALSKVSQVQNDVEKAVDALATGGDVTDAVLAIEKADMSFQLMVEIRNKLLTTYEEVMKMQV
jgi:flagellar hook-basal body complex protein FliE